MQYILCGLILPHTKLSNETEYSVFCEIASSRIKNNVREFERWSFKAHIQAVEQMNFSPLRGTYLSFMPHVTFVFGLLLIKVNQFRLFVFRPCDIFPPEIFIIFVRTVRYWRPVHGIRSMHTGMQSCSKLGQHTFTLSQKFFVQRKKSESDNGPCGLLITQQIY